MKNPKTQAAIRRQLLKQGKIKEPEVIVADKKQEKFEEYINRQVRMEQAKQRDIGPHSMKYIARWVCRTHLVSLAELRSDNRDKCLVVARQAFVYWCRRLTNKGLVTIGRYIHRDHSTTLYASRSYQKSRHTFRHLRRRK